MRRWKSRRRARQVEPGQKSLVYDVPEGQDPTAIVAALRQNGLEAIEVMRQGRQRVVISGPEGSAELRPQARRLIAQEVNASQVTFVDE